MLSPDSDLPFLGAPGKFTSQPQTDRLVPVELRQARKTAGEIWILDDNLVALVSLFQEIGKSGYDVRAFQLYNELLEALGQNAQPAALILDMVFPDNDLGGVYYARQLRQQHHLNSPIVFLSARNDLHARLAAVRVGSVGYLSKPASLETLLEKLDKLCLPPQEQDPYRVLVVEDGRTMAKLYETTLQQAGMRVTVVTNPLEVLKPLVDFHPDVILMDLYMPGSSGLELTKVIRQMDGHATTPIIFLSAETDPTVQLAAVRLGADDFLTKPIEPDHLVTKITAKALRARAVHGLVARDSMTGLLNHKAIQEALVREVNRAERLYSRMAFCMVDIDYFKEVNDTYGHPSGDIVLKNLATLLVDNLRREDIVGRYGGEEFGIILPDTDGHTAYETLDRLRLLFEAQEHHGTQGQTIRTITFSGGVASFPEYGDAEQLRTVADWALYEAKHAGRNQIVLAAA